MSALAQPSTPSVPGDLEAELTQLLGPSCFPARQDQLLATLIRNRAPSKLLWWLSGLSPFRIYDSVDAVVQDCQAPARRHPGRTGEW